MHTTNYTDTLILPSEDCKVTESTVPAKSDSIAGQQFAAIDAAPYGLTSDDLLVVVTAIRSAVPDEEQDALRAALFSKGQPCLRASPLVKSHGWAVHHDAQGRVALVAVGSDRFAALSDDPTVTKIRGMRSARR